MKKQILLTVSIVFLLVGCKNEPKETHEKIVPVAEEPVPASDEPERACYLYNEFGSVISLELSYNENNVSAIITYAFKEKDRNYGYADGKVENNVFIGDYKFQSEGRESTRQVAFLLKDNEAIEGYGEMTADGTKFKDVTKLKFNSTMPLKKHDCPK